jgi:RNA polymerase sigma-70 factor (ECF subfamily)
MPATPDDLLEGLAAGREEAFAALYDVYGVRLFAAACGMLASREEAEDAVQDVFVGLVQAGARLRQVENLTAYLFASLRHAAMRRMGRRKTSQFNAAEVAIPAADAGPDAEISRRLEVALRRLPREQREVIALHVDGSLTFAEVAAVLDLSADTAASRYRYAMEKLREAMKESERGAV